MDLKTIYQHLDLVKGRPGMFIGKHDIQNLFLYCSGYLNFITFNELDIKSNPDFRDFHDYIAVILGYKFSTAGWAHMLQEYYGNPELALEKFFIHLEDFKRDMKDKTPKEMGEFLKQKGYDLNFNFGNNL